MIHALLGAAVMAQAAPPTLHELLARDLTPGSVALLVRHGDDETAQDRLREALEHDRAEVRAAAGRVVHAGQVEELRAAISAALARETEVPAGVEIALAAASLARSRDAPDVVEARQRLGIGHVLERFSPIGLDARLPSKGAPGIRVATAYPPGFVEGVFEETACFPAGAPGVGGAHVSWPVDRAPAALSWLRQSVLPECVVATEILLQNTLPIPANPAAQEIVLLLLDPEMFACDVADADYLGPVLIAGKDVARPKRLREVAAQYPPAARQARLRGEVQIEARIGRSGCLRDLRILRSRDPRLDVAALRAVARWRYEPSRKGGEAVPILARAKVRFPPPGY